VVITDATMSRHPRPIRFVAGAGGIGDPDALLRAARRAEEMGYSALAMADHFMLPFAPLIALQAVAGVTAGLRLTQTVLDQDFRHPAVLAKELATLDVLSGGRLEVGIGAGWMRSEYEQAGMTFDPAPVRIERLEEVLIILKGLFGREPFSFSGKHFSIRELNGTPKPVQRPRPPIMIGGGGPKLLAAAARQADIIQLVPRIGPHSEPVDPEEFTAPSYQRKVGWIRDAAGDRFSDIELGVQLLNVTVTDDVDQTLDDLMSQFASSGRRAGRESPPSKDEILSSPVVAIGSLEQVCDKLMQVRDSFGFSYFACPVFAKPATLAPVIERLAGQ
jgi:probable F420-dependent oxidoreductase